MQYSFLNLNSSHICEIDLINSYLLCRPLSFDCRQEIDKQKSEGPNGIKESNFLQAVFSPLSISRLRWCFALYLQNYRNNDSFFADFTENGRK